MPVYSHHARPAATRPHHTPSSAQRQYFVHTLGNDLASVSLPANATVAQLKEDLALRQGHKCDLFFGGKLLEDRCTLFSYNVQRFSTLEQRPCGGLAGGGNGLMNEFWRGMTSGELLDFYKDPKQLEALWMEGAETDSDGNLKSTKTATVDMGVFLVSQSFNNPFDPMGAAVSVLLDLMTRLRAHKLGAVLLVVDGVKPPQKGATGNEDQRRQLCDAFDGAFSSRNAQSGQKVEDTLRGADDGLGEQDPEGFVNGLVESAQSRANKMKDEPLSDFVRQGVRAIYGDKPPAGAPAAADSPPAAAAAAAASDEKVNKANSRAWFLNENASGNSRWLDFFLCVEALCEVIHSETNGKVNFCTLRALMEADSQIAATRTNYHISVDSDIVLFSRATEGIVMPLWDLSGKEMKVSAVFTEEEVRCVFSDKLGWTNPANPNMPVVKRDLLLLISMSRNDYFSFTKYNARGIGIDAMLRAIHLCGRPPGDRVTPPYIYYVVYAALILRDKRWKFPEPANGGAEAVIWLTDAERQQFKRTFDSLNRSIPPSLLPVISQETLATYARARIYVAQDHTKLILYAWDCMVSQPFVNMSGAPQRLHTVDTSFPQPFSYFANRDGLMPFGLNVEGSGKDANNESHHNGIMEFLLQEDKAMMERLAQEQEPVHEPSAEEMDAARQFVLEQQQNAE